MNDNRIEYSYVVPVIAQRFDALMPYNDNFYVQNKQPELDQYGTIGFCSQGTPGKIAIVDSVFQMNHPDLFIDEPFDVTDQDTNVEPPIWTAGNIQLGFFHGTTVAGVADGITNNNIGMASVAEGINYLIAIKTVADNSSPTQSTHALEGFIEADARGANVINLSFGRYYSGACAQERQDAINTATADGTVVFATVGNGGLPFPNSPASCNGVYAVGSVGPSGSVSSFNNGGAEICGPGESIFTTRPISTYIQDLNGTSAASPFLASALAAGINIFHYLKPSTNGNCPMLDLKLCTCGDNIVQSWEECDTGPNFIDPSCVRYKNAIPSNTGACGEIANTTIYDFNNSGDSLSINTPGLCASGMPTFFAFNPFTHSRRRRCFVSGGESVKCNTQEAWCGNGIVDSGSLELCDGTSGCNKFCGLEF